MYEGERKRKDKRRRWAGEGKGRRTKKAERLVLFGAAARRFLHIAVKRAPSFVLLRSGRQRTSDRLSQIDRLEERSGQPLVDSSMRVRLSIDPPRFSRSALHAVTARERQHESEWDADT